jgi:3-oxoacyl-[acyl-carrier-protein] synthase-3
VLLVGAELHSHSLDYTTRGRDVTVLFGDGAGAMVLGPRETDDAREGVLYTKVGADGTGAWDLHLKVFDVRKMPHFLRDDETHDPKNVYPQMDGKRVFLNAVRAMCMTTKARSSSSASRGPTSTGSYPTRPTCGSTRRWCNTPRSLPRRPSTPSRSTATPRPPRSPSRIDHHRKKGTVKRGDLVLSSVFGAGFTYGAAVYRFG